MRSEHYRHNLQVIYDFAVVRSWQTLRARLAIFRWLPYPAPASTVTIQIVHLEADLSQLIADLADAYERQELQGTLGE
jgi:hypothetical protein